MHEQFLLAALEKAWLGRGFCAPNPSVGAVAVQNSKIIAQSWHHGAGTPHAEVLLLQQLPENCKDVSVYVTLEPCNHWGKTPPCVDALIRHGIKRLIYAYADPNPKVRANNSTEQLMNAGISVVHYPMPEIDHFYQSYEHWTRTGRPWVTVKLAQTFDGKIAGDGGARVSLSNALCADFTHKHRLHSDIILTTARTINQDDPLLTARTAEKSMAKRIAIIDSQGVMNQTAAVLNEALHCDIYGSAERRGLNGQQTTFHPMPLTASGYLDLHAIIKHLGELGFHDVWVEAGGALFHALHEAGLVNRTYVYLVPTTLGDAALSAYCLPDVLNQPRRLQWHAMEDNVIAQFDWLEK
jgi:diaminohydroxyphosphoribosylaminopyrimidine deaminase/5-amino-6-(5-phosphoribosylamino)uracil reductase